MPIGLAQMWSGFKPTEARGRLFTVARDSHSEASGISLISSELFVTYRRAEEGGK